MIRETGRVWARLYQWFSCWAYKYLDCIAHRWWRTRRRQWRAWWATRKLLVLHPPFAAARSASATWQLLALYVAALAWESWPLCLPSRWGKQFLWEQGCGCSKAMVLYTWSIYTDQTISTCQSLAVGLVPEIGIRHGSCHQRAHSLAKEMAVKVGNY